MSRRRQTIARRLVEAGVTFITVQAGGGWDTHGNNFTELKRRLLPQYDTGVAALVEDLADRGLSDDVLVMSMGEFGRTPKINKDAGRDHWNRVNGALLAGGGMKVGQVIGSTDRQAALAKDRPVHFQEVFATLYRNLGLRPNTQTVTDLAGRPHYLVDDPHEPIRELI